jgi:hypothetical protein
MIARQDVEEQQALGSKSKQPAITVPKCTGSGRAFLWMGWMVE